VVRDHRTQAAEALSSATPATTPLCQDSCSLTEVIESERAKERDDDPIS